MKVLALNVGKILQIRFSVGFYLALCKRVSLIARPTPATHIFIVRNL